MQTGRCAQCTGLNFGCSLINRKFPPEPQPIWTTHFGHSISWSLTPKMWWKTPSSRSGSGSHSQTALIGTAEPYYYYSRMSRLTSLLVLAKSRLKIFLLKKRTSVFNRYFETISDVLSSVRKMEESLKRLKQARKTATTSNVGINAGPSDDSKIRLQLALDVEYLGEQVWIQFLMND